MCVCVYFCCVTQRACSGSLHGNRAPATIQGNRYRSKKAELLCSSPLLTACCPSSGSDPESQRLVCSHSSGRLRLEPQRQAGILKRNERSALCGRDISGLRSSEKPRVSVCEPLCSTVHGGVRVAEERITDSDRAGASRPLLR